MSSMVLAELTPHAKRIDTLAYGYPSQKLVTKNMPGKNVFRNVFQWWQKMSPGMFSSGGKNVCIGRRDLIWDLVRQDGRSSIAKALSPWWITTHSSAFLLFFLPLWCRSARRLAWLPVPKVDRHPRRKNAEGKNEIKKNATKILQEWECDSLRFILVVNYASTVSAHIFSSRKFGQMINMKN
jgi:hypothetical protein